MSSNPDPRVTASKVVAGPEDLVGQHIVAVDPMIYEGEEIHVPRLLPGVPEFVAAKGATDRLTSSGTTGNVVRPGYSTCERDANVSPSMRVHARVTTPRQIPPVCGAFVAAETQPCPRFPALAQDGKEGVGGSSPPQGLKVPANRRIVLSK
jgi:hypothetical protein